MRLRLSTIVVLIAWTQSATAAGPCTGYLIAPTATPSVDEPGNWPWEPGRADYVIALSKAGFGVIQAGGPVVKIPSFLMGCEVAKLKTNQWGRTFVIAMPVLTSPVFGSRAVTRKDDGIDYQKLYVKPSELIPFEYTVSFLRREEQMPFDNLQSIQKAARAAVGSLNRNHEQTPAPAGIVPSSP